MFYCQKSPLQPFLSSYYFYFKLSWVTDAVYLNATCRAVFLYILRGGKEQESQSHGFYYFSCWRGFREITFSPMIFSCVSQKHKSLVINVHFNANFVLALKQFHFLCIIMDEQKICFLLWHLTYTQRKPVPYLQ